MAAGFAQAGVVFIARGLNSFISSINRAAASVEKFNRRIAKTTISAMTRGINRLAEGLDELTPDFSGLDRLESQAKRLSSTVFPLLLKSIAAVTLAIAGISAAGLSTAISFESAFAGVTKTVDTFLDRTRTAEDGVITLTEAGEGFRDSLVELSSVIPVTFEKLSEIAGLGGQLGIVEGLAGDEAQEALLSFTETVAGLAEATDVTQRVAATSLAQISNIFRGSVDDVGENVERLGATLVELGNTSAATESLILNFARRISGAGETVGLTQAEVLGIGTAFASIGITAEAGSTAVNRALLIINEAVSNSHDVFLDNTAAINETIEAISDLQADLVRLEFQTGITGKSLTAQKEAFLEAGGAAEDFGLQLGDARREQLFQTQVEIDRLRQKLDQLRVTQGQAVTTEVFDELLRVVQNTAEGAEQTAESFRELFTEDPAEAFALFVEGLAEEGERAGETLDRIGLGSVEATRAFLAIAGASDLVRDRIMAATRAFEENQALTDEVSVRYATLRSNILELINVFKGITDRIFAPLIGPLNEAVEWGKELVTVLGESIPRVITALANKFGPELREVFDELFGGGLFAGGEITTPEGFVLSGEAIGIEPASITAIKNATDSLVESINAIDVSGLSDQAIALRDTIIPIWTGAIEFAKEHTDLLTGAVKGLITVLGGTILIGAITKVATALGALTTPLGQLALLAVGLNIAWETNFLGIQEITASVIDQISTSFDRLVEKIKSFDLGNLISESLIPGDELTTPEGFILSGEAIGIDPTFLDQLSQATNLAAGAIGNLTALVIKVPADQISGLVDLFQGLVNVISALWENSQQVARTLDGLQLSISGFVDALLAPLENLAELLGIDFDTQPIKDAGFNAARDFVSGFIEGFTGTNVEDLNLSFSSFIEAITGLGESEGIRIFLAGLAQMGEGLQDLAVAFGDLVSALKGLVGLEPDESLFIFLGQLTGFILTVSVDQLVNLVNALTGLVVVLTGIANLDLSTITEGLGDFGLAVLDIPLDFAQRISDAFSGPNIRLILSQALLDLIAFLQNNMSEGFISLDVGQAIADWITGLNNQIVDGINNIIGNIQTAFSTNITLQALTFSLNLLADIEELDQQITDLIDQISRSLALEALTLSLNILADAEQLDEDITTFIDDVSVKLAEATKDIVLSLPGFDEEEVTKFLDEVSLLTTKVKNRFIGLLTGVDVGLPSFQSILDEAQTVVDKIKGFFSGLFDDLSFDLPDFGVLEKLAEIGLIDLDVEAPDTEGLGTDLAQGVIDEVEEAEEEWDRTWTDFILSPIETTRKLLDIKSPSGVTEQIGKDLVEGLALGLSDLTPIEQAIMGIDSLILEGFSGLITQMNTGLVPAVENTNTKFVTLYSDTWPRTVSILVDELIPAKRELSEVNLLELIPSVDQLIEAEERLRDTLSRVKTVLERLISLKEKATTRSKTLKKEIDKLAQAYLALAAAIESAEQAGDGLNDAPSGPAGPEFQSGGSFIVPQSVGKEGMPIRVHAGELVQIIPARFTDRLRSLPSDLLPSSVQSPRLSGAPINNIISTNNNQSFDTSTTKEFHLHVTESPTSDVRDSFELMEILS